MSLFKFTPADQYDDAELRQRMQEDVMEGVISVSFRREPCYFIGTGVQGDTAEVIKVVDTQRNKIVGMGARLTFNAFINGQVQRMGYLSDLRLDKKYRGGTLLYRGYRYFRHLHTADPVSLYYSLILQGNTLALENITRARAGLPVYRDFGLILTPAIHLDLPRKIVTQSGLKIQQAEQKKLTAVFDFIQGEYAHKQFAPVYHAKDVGQSRLKGLAAEDIYVASRQGKIVGVIAAWNQQAFRQTHIEKYHTLLHYTRPFYNLSARFLPLKPLPDIGAVIPYFYLALTAIENNDPDIFRAMLSQLYEDRRHGPWHYFIAGLHEHHPLAQVLHEYRSIKAAGHLFIIHYPEDTKVLTQLDERIPHIEIGAV